LGYGPNNQQIIARRRRSKPLQEEVKEEAKQNIIAIRSKLLQ
jgi:hypothetical protein